MENDSIYTLQIKEGTRGTITFNNVLYEKILKEITELKKYEYSCVEQTASKLKATIYENNIVQAMGRKAVNADSVFLLINKLKEFQNFENTWGWWRKQGTEWRISLYVIDVLFTANANGFTNSVYFNALQKLKRDFNLLTTSDKLYAMYILQKTKNWKDAYRNELSKMQVEDLNTTDKLYYYKIKTTIGDSVSLNNMYSLFIEMKNNCARPYYNSFFYDPKSEIYTAYSLFQNTVLQNELMQVFEKKLYNSSLEQNLNTFAKAYMIEALAIKAKNSSTNNLQSTLLINDSLKVNTYPFVMPINNASYKIKHTGAEVFCNTTEAIEIENPNTHDSIFKIETNFANAQNINMQQLKAGKAVSLQVSLNVFRTAENVMVEIPIPSGMQIINKTDFGSQYIQYFKHKIVVFYNKLPMGNYNLSFQFQPNFKGTFSMPAAKASLMYYPYIYGCNQNKKVVIE